MIYFIVQNILMLFFIFYLNIFCALYSKSQGALFKNYVLGAINSLIYSLIIALVVYLAWVIRQN